MANRAVSWETRSYFLFFWYGMQWNSADRIGGIHVLFGDKNLKHLGGIHWNRGILAELEAFGLKLRQNPWFQWNHHGFQVFTPKNTWIRQFRRPSFTETVPKKKRAVSLLKPKLQVVIFWQTLLSGNAKLLHLSNSGKFMLLATGGASIWAWSCTPSL